MREYYTSFLLLSLFIRSPIPSPSLSHFSISPPRSGGEEGVATQRLVGNDAHAVQHLQGACDRSQLNAFWRPEKRPFLPNHAVAYTQSCRGYVMQAGLLVTNAVAILHPKRFLAKCKPKAGRGGSGWRHRRGLTVMSSRSPFCASLRLLCLRRVRPRGSQRKLHSDEEPNSWSSASRRLPQKYVFVPVRGGVPRLSPGFCLRPSLLLLRCCCCHLNEDYLSPSLPHPTHPPPLPFPPRSTVDSNQLFSYGFRTFGRGLNSGKPETYKEMHDCCAHV